VTTYTENPLLSAWVIVGAIKSEKDVFRGTLQATPSACGYYALSTLSVLCDAGDSTSVFFTLLITFCMVKGLRSRRIGEDSKVGLLPIFVPGCGQS
jgi:hypothetical protein